MGILYWIQCMTCVRPLSLLCWMQHLVTLLRITWWRHQMETFSALLALCEGNTPVTGEFPSQRPVTWSFDVFFDLRLNKRLSKQPRFRWFKTPLRSLWSHCNSIKGLWYKVTCWWLGVGPIQAVISVYRWLESHVMCRWVTTAVLQLDQMFNDCRPFTICYPGQTDPTTITGKRL